jgi:hypothetical protein
LIKVADLDDTGRTFWSGGAVWRAVVASCELILDRIAEDELAGLIEDAWRLTAGNRLVSRYDEGS